MNLIKKIYAREILDSRGNPTVEVTMEINNGVVVKSSVPSGASTGSKEALELRDGDINRYNGKGVLKAVENVNKTINGVLMGKELNQKSVDEMLIKLDGTDNKSRLGANAILAVSLCTLKALAKCNNKELYENISDGRVSLPIPFVNVLNGGVHASNNLDIQEFMIVPVVKGMEYRIRVATEIFQTLKGILKSKNLSTTVGDEGGFAPNLSNNFEAIELLIEAIKKSGYKPGIDVYIALDVAASELYNKQMGQYKIDGHVVSSNDLLKYYEQLINKYPIISIEDPFEENDIESLAKLTAKYGEKVMFVGDDTFVTNKKYLQIGINHQAGNSILLKANQIGTISEMLETIELANKNGYRTIISHRSGETLDTFIADLAVGLNIPFIKAGSMSRGERIAKYNRLTEIEYNLKNK